MLRVTVEMWPMGNEKKKYQLGVMEIANVTPGRDKADYHYVAEIDHRGRKRTVSGSILRHQREDGWGPLVQRVVSSVCRAVNLPVE